MYEKTALSLWDIALGADQAAADQTSKPNACGATFLATRNDAEFLRRLYAVLQSQ
jgi:hypothetical protein